MKWQGRIIKIGMICSLLCVLSLSRQQYRMAVQESIANKVIRFHVLANSDSPYDQQVKKRVRDEVGAYVQPLLKESRTKEKSRQIMLTHLEDITRVANESLKKQGVSYRAYATLCYCQFPVKSYQGVSFPAGRYEALEVVIGKGRGHNWWCVMYPNLCFSASMKKEHDRQWRRFLQSLSPREFEAMMQKNRWKVRFKIFDLLHK
ncbi:stage II sporulation protein R [Lachnospiraceae bacterium XBB1006]|nr:stage II sporulation protein R [Lachnospiraceae bacterium XBB1006]